MSDILEPVLKQADAPSDPVLATPKIDRASEPVLAMDLIQGDILVGLQKEAEALVFFQITSPCSFSACLRSLPITSAQLAWEREGQIAAAKQAGRRLSIPGLNVAFTFAGLSELGLLDGGDLEGQPFREGLAARRGRLNDPEHASWKLLGPGVTLHGVFVVTGDTPAEVNAFVDRYLLPAGAHGFREVGRMDGVTRPGPAHGREHFGFLDGVSQPGVRGKVGGGAFLQPSHPDAEPDQGLPGQDLLWPGEFVFGYQGQLGSGDRTQPTPEPVLGSGLDWMRNGAYLVVRRLEQLVPEMHEAVRGEAARNHLDPELLGAQMVGRWQSGAPVILAPAADDKGLAADPARNNDFEFGDDRGGALCPWAAHIRKAYPRDDVRGKVQPTGGEIDEAEAFTQTRRMMRRGIPFGPEVSDDERLSGRTRHERGLLFKCYVTDIDEQFEFVQQFWLNAADFSQEGAGLDPIVGQAPDGGVRPFKDAGRKHDFSFEPWLIMTGGGYFFAPAIDVLKGLTTKDAG